MSSPLCFPKEKRWLDELTIHVLFAEDITSGKKPQRFYVKACVRGQKLRMRQKTEAIALDSSMDNDGTKVASWYQPMKFKICIQSLFQNPCFEFRVMRAVKNKLFADQVIGVVTVPVKELYDHAGPNSMRYPIVSRGGKCKGFFCLSKVDDM